MFENQNVDAHMAMIARTFIIFCVKLFWLPKTYHWGCSDISNTTGATCGSGTAYPPRALERVLGGVCIAQYLVFYVVFCVLLYMFNLWVWMSLYICGILPFSFHKNFFQISFDKGSGCVYKEHKSSRQQSDIYMRGSN